MDDAELFAPTTEQVRTEYVVSGADAPTPRLHAGAAFDRWLAAHDREVAAKALDLTPAELLHLAADLQQDTRAKIGPRLTGAQKVIDAAQAIIRSPTPSTETNGEQRA